jgi:hypothetical protein
MTLKWQHVPESRYDEMLNILPPLCHRHDRSMLGEPTDHNGPNGHARYLAFVRFSADRCYQSTEPLTIPQFRCA